MSLSNYRDDSMTFAGSNTNKVKYTDEERALALLCLHAAAFIAGRATEEPTISSYHERLIVESIKKNGRVLKSCVVYPLERMLKKYVEEEKEGFPKARDYSSFNIIVRQTWEAADRPWFTEEEMDSSFKLYYRKK